MGMGRWVRLAEGKGIDASFGCAEPCPTLPWETGAELAVQCGHREDGHRTCRPWTALPSLCRTESFSRTQQAHKPIVRKPGAARETGQRAEVHIYVCQGPRLIACLFWSFFGIGDQN